MENKAYFGWGAFNGIILGISIVNGIDISETGIAIELAKAFKPLLQDLGLSVGWITASIILLSIIGIFSLISESIKVYNEGGKAMFYAITGFLGFFFIIIGLETLGIISLVLGVIVGAAESRR